MDFYKNINQRYAHLRENKSLFYVALSLLAVCYVITAMQLPVTIRSHAFHDDYLFWVNGNHIYNGDWLGPYSQMTLAKGAGFPLFLALNAKLGLPITLSIALFNLAAFSFMALTLVKIGISRPVAILITAFALFNPHLFPTLIIRDNIYPAATVIVIFAFVQLCTFQRTHYFFAILSGFLLGFYWMIREEGVWIIPGLIALLFIYTFLLLRRKEFALVKQISKNLSILLISFFIIIQTVSALNFLHYKFYGTVDFKEEYYKKSVNMLNAIEPKKRISHVPVSKEQRQIAYSVSPAFAELKNYFEVTGAGWTLHGCNFYPASCGDYAGGWFIWAYRDAVANLGYYKSGETASDFYKKIYTEISDACTAGIINCRKNHFGFLPALTQEQIDLAPDAFMNAIDLVTYKTNVNFDAGPSTEPYDKLNFAKLFLRNPLTSPATNEEKARMIGWFHHKGSAWPSLHCNTSGAPDASVMIRQPSPDILKGTGDPAATHQRFTISLNNLEGCQLHYEGATLNLHDVITAGAGRFNFGNGVTLHFDAVILSPMAEFRKESFELKSKLITFYKSITPILLGVGLLFFIISFTFQLFTRQLSFLSILTFSLWVLSATRVFILILVDISSFPAVQPGYMGPVFPLLALTSSLSIILFITLIQKILTRKNQCNSPY